MDTITKAICGLLFAIVAVLGVALWFKGDQLERAKADAMVCRANFKAEASKVKILEVENQAARDAANTKVQPIKERAQANIQDKATPVQDKLTQWLKERGQ